MATRRCISKNVMRTEKFLDLSFEAQALFAQLQLETDEQGFVATPKAIMRMIGASSNALDELIDAGFIHMFESGHVVMLDFFVANSIQNDRNNGKVLAPNELAQLQKGEDRRYILVEHMNGIQMESNWNPDGIQMDSPTSKETSKETSKGTSTQTQTVTKHTTTTVMSSSSSSDMSDRARERKDDRLDDDDDLNVLLNTLFQYSWMKPSDVKTVKRLYKTDGYSPELILFGAQQADRYNAQSIAYLVRILQGYKKQGFTTVEQVQEMERQRERFNVDNNTSNDPYHKHIEDEKENSKWFL